MTETGAKDVGEKDLKLAMQKIIQGIIPLISKNFRIRAKTIDRFFRLEPF
jgi:hypothetical protein